MNENQPLQEKVIPLPNNLYPLICRDRMRCTVDERETRKHKKSKRGSTIYVRETWIKKKVFGRMFYSLTSLTN